jgi:putative protease
MMALAPISLKIEGRMKSPEYVFAVVSAYRHALDGVGCEEDINMLSRVFNRRYTAGHLWQSPFKDFMNYELPSHFGTILGKVIESRDGEIVLRLMDDIAMGDEMQKRFNGKTVGGRVEQLFKGREKIMAAHCGDTVRVNFKHRAAVNDVIYKTYDTQYLTEIERTRQISHAVYGLTMRFDAVIGERAILAATDENGEKVTVYSTNDVACARKISLDAPRVEQQLGKLGGTVYYMTAVETAIDTQAALPVSEINHMRREAVDFLMSKRAVRYPERQTKAVDQMAPSAAADITKAETQIAQTKVTSDVCLDIHVYHSEQLTKVTSMKRKHRILIHDLTYFRNTMAAAVQNRHVPVLPVIIRNREWPQVKTFIEVYVQTCESLKCEPVVCIGHVAHLILGDLYPSLQFILDSTCNLMNQSALDFVFEKQIDTTYLATEMKRDEIAALDLTDKAFGYNAFGHLTLMQSAYCAVGGVLAGHSHCGACQHESYQLEDEHGHSFPLICNSENCHMTVLSEYPISVLDQLNALASLGVRNFKIDMVGLSPEKIQNLIDHLDEHKPLTFKTGGRRFVEKGID